MDLVHAFRILAPNRPDDPRGNRRRQRAARAIHATLMSIAAAIVDTPEQREEVVQQTLLKLTSGGPRDDANAPDSEQRVIRYLRRAVRNNWNSLLRKLRRERFVSPPPGGAAVRQAETSDGFDGYTFEDIRRAWHRLRVDVIPALLADGRGSDRTAVALDEMIGLRLGEIRQEDLIDAERDDGDAFKRARDASQQRHKNTRNRLLAKIDDLLRNGELTAERADLLRSSVILLKRRRTERGMREGA